MIKLDQQLSNHRLENYPSTLHISHKSTQLISKPQLIPLHPTKNVPKRTETGTLR